jgi:hypothetical protein
VHANLNCISRTREPRTAPVDIHPPQPMDDLLIFPNDVCWTINPPAGGWNPTARYRVEIYGGGPGAARIDTGYTAACDANGRSTSHSYSFYASAAATQEIPMVRSGGLLKYRY